MENKPNLVFFHQNYPAQFGPIIQFLQENSLANIYFFSEFASKKPLEGIKHYFYKSDISNLTDTPYFFSRYFEAECRSMFGVYNALQNAKIPSIDALIGHVGFGNLGLLHSSFKDIPRIGFFELFYDAFNIQNIERAPFKTPPANLIRIPLRNALHLIELEYCTKGYSPTNYQKSSFPLVYQNKIEVLFDGIDANLYTPLPSPEEELQLPIPNNTPIVTFVSRGLEAMRGFDIFMEMAHKLSLKNSDIHFVIVGREKTNYGHELIHLKEKSFKEYVLKKFPYNLNRFHFIEWLSEKALAELFRKTTCHFYWTMPFVLSWSFFQAMSSGALILASNNAPVQELINNEENGLLVNPLEIEEMIEKILKIIENPNKFISVKQAARKTIEENYSFEICLPKLADFYLKS